MSSTTEQGTASIQGRLWGIRVDEWAAIQEGQTKPAFEAALEALAVGPGTRLLDVGCGAGLALRLAADRGADVSGLDASEGMLVHARRRVPGAPLVQGEIEHLPLRRFELRRRHRFQLLPVRRTPRQRSCRGRTGGRRQTAACCCSTGHRPISARPAHICAGWAA